MATVRNLNKPGTLHSPAYLHSEILGRLAEKQAKQRVTVALNMPSLYDVQDYVMIGSFSWYLQEAKRRLLLRQFTMTWPDVLSTPSDLVRAYLDIKYPRLRATKEQVLKFQVSRSAPLYAQPRECEEGVYIDLRGAYWQIVQTLGWDVDYNPGVWLGKGVPMADWPYADMKLTRNCLVTAGLNAERNIWDGYARKYKNVGMGNTHTNLGLWSAVMDILHGLASDAIACGCFYVHTDGYICDRQNLPVLLEAFESWGIEAGIKAAGKTVVYGVGTYSVGQNTTKNPKVRPSFFDGVNRSEHHQWLKKRYKFFADRTDYKWTSDYHPTATANYHFNPLTE